MLSQDQQSEISLLENQLKAVSQQFDIAIKKDMVLGEAKKLFKELKAISSRLDQLKDGQIINETLT